MLSQIEAFVNWLRLRNPAARTWRDYGYDLRQIYPFDGIKTFTLMDGNALNKG